MPTKILSKKWDIIMLDRFDLYFNDSILKALLEKQSESVILLDLKNNTHLQRIPSKYVELLLTENKIEVSL